MADGMSRTSVGLAANKIYPTRSVWIANVFFVVIVTLGVLASSGCRRKEPQAVGDGDSVVATPWFKEVAAEVHVPFTHVPFFVRRFYMPENNGTGVALFDYDGDGYLDLYLVQAGDLEASSAENPGNKLYHNLGDGTFEDVTERAGVGDTGYGVGCACGDYDGDGDVDLYVTNVGPNVLYRNNGDGTFTDVTSTAGVGDPSWGTSCAFVDIDADGDLDLFITNYLNWTSDHELVCLGVRDQRDYCLPDNYHAPASDTLYRNNGDGTFLEVSRQAGLANAFGHGLGIACGDYDGDGDMDVYVANDGMPNQLWINKGDGHFTDRALLLGCALSGTGMAEAGMGVMAVDIESDGDLDLFLSHLRNESNTFYLNSGGAFDDMTARRGLASSSLPYTGFGLGFVDFDHDGHLDLFIANGRVSLHEPMVDRSRPYVEPNLLYRGGEQGRFVEVMPRGGTDPMLIESSRAAAFGDIDNDGRVDIVVVNVGAKVHVLRNIVESRGEWVMFRVLNRRGTDAVGARVRVEAGGRTFWSTVQRVYSYCASNDPRVHFGLGHVTRIDKVTVRWPRGAEESFGPFDVGKLYDLRQGAGHPP